MAMRMATCPECGQRMTLRGLFGHLRFGHSYNLKAARKVMSDSELSEEERSIEERSEKILDVIKRWKESYELEQFLTSEEVDLVGNRYLSEEAYTETQEYLIESWNDFASELRFLSGLDNEGHPVK